MYGAGRSLGKPFDAWLPLADMETFAGWETQFLTTCHTVLALQAVSANRYRLDRGRGRA
jgi:hypothetical protein